MVLKGLGSALVITATQSTTQFIMCALSSKKSVNCPQHPLVWSCSPETPTANIPCTQTALTFAAPNSQSSWYKPPTTAIAQSCPSYLSHSNTHCHYYDWPALYCIISFNSAGPVTHDGPAEILVSTTSQNRRDKPKFWEIFGSLAPQATNFFINLSHDHQMNSAPNKNYRDYRDISGFWRALWRVTAELNEMVQYSCPMIHEESSRVNNGEAIEVLEGGVRRDWERSDVSTNL